MASARSLVVIVEPFCGGSHAQMVKWLSSALPAADDRADVHLVTLAAKKWHWRLRASSMWVAEQVPTIDGYTHATLLVSSMCNLAEVLALRPDLHRARKVLYFHENQLCYPTRQRTGPPAGASAVAVAAAGGAAAVASTPAGYSDGGDERDFQFGWAQILSALAADLVCFNSVFNMESFLELAEPHLGHMPTKDQKVGGVGARIRAKSRVLYFPVEQPPPPAEPVAPVAAAVVEPAAAALPPSVAATAAAAVDAEAAAVFPAAPLPPAAPSSPSSFKSLTLLWPHRWEYDKRPDVFFEVLQHLHAKRSTFRVIVLGEQFPESPPCFAEHKPWLEAGGYITHWGYAPTKADYWRLVRSADVVVSTADHEFFGVAVVEAAMAGCYPLCPARLAYPEVLAPLPSELAAASGGSEDAAAPAAAGAAGGASATADAASRSGAATAAGAAVGSSGSGGGGKARRLPPIHDRVDARPCEHLYKSTGELKRTLNEWARNPGAVRAWRAAGGHEKLGLARLAPEALLPQYLRVLLPPR